MIAPSSREHIRGATIAITSGKGGVGKTSVTVNLAVSLSRLGYRVGVLDADFGLGNVDVMLGLTPRSHVGFTLSGEKTLEEVAVDGPGGIIVIPAGSGIRALTALTAAQRRRLADTVAAMRRDLDFLLVDTAPGIDDQVFDLASLADRVIVVTSSEPTAMVDGYAMVKLLLATIPDKEISVVVNAARTAEEGERVFRQMDAAAMRFLGRSVRYDGCIARDPTVGEAVMRQRPVVSHVPESPASLGFRRLALRVANTMASGAPERPPVVPRLMSPEEFARTEAPQCA